MFHQCLIDLDLLHRKVPEAIAETTIVVVLKFLIGCHMEEIRESLFLQGLMQSTGVLRIGNPLIRDRTEVAMIVVVDNAICETSGIKAAHKFKAPSHAVAIGETDPIITTAMLSTLHLIPWPSGVSV